MNGSAYGGGTDFWPCAAGFSVSGCRAVASSCRRQNSACTSLPAVCGVSSPASGRDGAGRAGDSHAQEELLRIGYLTDLVAPDALKAKVQAYVDAILQCEREAVNSMKQHIDALALGTWSEAAGRAAYEDSLGSPAAP